MLNRNVFPSLQRRGGRAIKKTDAEGHQSWHGRGGQSSKRVCNAVLDISCEMTTPSAPQRWLRSSSRYFPPSLPQKRRGGCAGLAGFVPLSPKLTHDFLED